MATVQDAIRALAAADPDRARILNAVGFNKADSWLGHTMAGLPDEAWTPEMAREAWELLRKYRRQLGLYGIAWEEIPEPEKVGSRHQARAQTRSAKRKLAGDDAKRIRQEPDGSFSVSFAYNRELVALVKQIPGRAWDGLAKRWVIQPTPEGIAALARFARANRFNLDEASKEALFSPEAEQAIEETLSIPERRIEREGERYAIHFPYDRELVEAVKGVPGRRFDRERKLWTAPAASAPALAALAAEHGFHAAEDIAEELKGSAQAAEQRKEASRAADAELEDIEGLHGDLYPFQRAGVAYVREAGSSIIGDEMGLGKTVQAIAAVAAEEAYPALVVCPASLKGSWERHFRAWLPERSVAVLNGTKRDALPEADILILNYDVLAKWQEAIERAPLRALILDESHYAKNAKAQRTKAARSIAGLSSLRLRLALTGTPVLNRPIELVSQLEILGRLDELGGFWGFVKRYCDAKRVDIGRGRTAWDFSGASNLGELNERLRSTCYVRRLKREVLAELPPKIRATVPVPIDNREEYTQASADVVAWLREQAAREADFLAEIADLDPEEQRARIRERKADAEASALRAEMLVRINTLRQVAARGKLAAAREWIASFLESGEKLLVFAHHREIGEALARAFPDAALIRGGDDTEERQRNVDRFQEDPDCTLMIASLKAGGVGLTLTAASNVAFVELGWTPAEHDQAEDRTHRIGQEAASVTAWYLLGERTIDEDMAELIDAKRQVVDAATDGREAASGPGILGALVERLTRDDDASGRALEAAGDRLAESRAAELRWQDEQAAHEIEAEGAWLRAAESDPRMADPREW